MYIKLDMMAKTWHPRITRDSGLDIGHEIICWLFAKIDTFVIQLSSLIDLFRRCPNQFEKSSDPLGFDEDPLNSGRYGGSGGVTLCGACDPRNHCSNPPWRRTSVFCDSAGMNMKEKR